SGQFLTVLPLPSASRYNRQHMLNVKQCRFSDRGLSPHKFTPMLGVHTALHPTKNRYAVFVG
ncbi:MAG: hypothetical protein ACXV9T_13035, partial [Methylobacter sp.]